MSSSATFGQHELRHSALRSGSLIGFGTPRGQRRLPRRHEVPHVAVHRQPPRAAHGAQDQRFGHRRRGASLRIDEKPFRVTLKREPLSRGPTVTIALAKRIQCTNGSRLYVAKPTIDVLEVHSRGTSKVTQLPRPPSQISTSCSREQDYQVEGELSTDCAHTEMVHTSGFTCIKRSLHATYNSSS
jgi:hypothetical protein